MCPASQARKGGGGVRGGAPSARPRRPARPLAHAPPPAVRHGDAPEEVDPGLALAFGRPGGLRWDFPFYATKSRFVGQVLPCRPSRAASRSARRGKTGLTHPKNLPLCTPGGTMTPASHPPPAARAARARVPQTAFSWQKSNYSIARPAVPSWEAVLDAPRGRRLPPPPAALPPSRSPQVGQITDFVPSTLRHLGRTFHLSA